MTNTIKMDLCRMVKSISTWMVYASAILLMFSTLYVRYSGILGNQTEKVPLYELAGNVQSGVMLIFVVIFSALFVNAEHRTGFIKNIAGQVHHRGVLILSKVVSVAVFTLILFLSIFAVVVLSSQLFAGGVNSSELPGLLNYLGMQVLLHIAFGSVIICIVTLFRSSAAGMTAGILLAVGFGSPVYTVADMLLHKIGVNGNFSISDYMLTTNIGQLVFKGSLHTYMRPLIIAMVFIAATTAIGIYVFQKRDIK